MIGGEDGGGLLESMVVDDWWRGWWRVAGEHGGGLGCPRNEKKKKFGSNRNKPKQDLFRVCFGLFCETPKKNFRFVSVFRTCIETAETNRTVSKRTETIRNLSLTATVTV